MRIKLSSRYWKIVVFFTTPVVSTLWTLAIAFTLHASRLFTSDPLLYLAIGMIVLMLSTWMTFSLTQYQKVLHQKHPERVRLIVETILWKTARLFSGHTK